MRYTFDAAPYVSYGVLSQQGDLAANLDITAANMPRPVMMHDFAITQNWVVFMDHPLTFDGEVRQDNLLGPREGRQSHCCWCQAEPLLGDVDTGCAGHMCLVVHTS